MTINDIKALIVADASWAIELKKTTGELKGAMHSARAFLSINIYNNEIHEESYNLKNAVLFAHECITTTSIIAER